MFSFPFNPSSLIDKPEVENVGKKQAHQEVKTKTKKQVI